jgi:hypothetical protein
VIIDFLSPHGFPEGLKVPFEPIKILLATRIYPVLKGSGFVKR